MAAADMESEMKRIAIVAALAVSSITLAAQSQSWDAKFLRWRLANPDSTYVLHVGPDALTVSTRDHGPLGIPFAVLCKVFPRPGATLPLKGGRYVTAACRAHRAPVCVYGGWNAHVRVRGGAYWEPGRFEDVGGRIHETFGIDLRIGQFHLWGPRRGRLSLTSDVATRYRNAGISIGFWH